MLSVSFITIQIIQFHMQGQPVVVDGETLRRNTPYDELISRIEDAFVAYHEGNVEMPEKSYVDVEKYNGDFRSMPAYVDAEDWESSGLKWVNVHPENTEVPTVMGTFINTDPRTGEPQAIIDGTEMTKRRTATVAAIATKHMTSEDVRTLGILGAGEQSYEQLRAIRQVRDIRQVLVCDKSDEAVEQFRQEFDHSYKVSRVAPSELSQADVVCTLTPSTNPIIDSLDGVSHVNAMGADAPNKQELHPNILKNSRIFLDDWDQCVHSGEVSKPIEMDQISEEHINGTLGKVVSGDHQEDLRFSRTVFDSTGLAIQDIATSSLVMDNVETENLEEADLF